jgi:hypothetical protein
VFFTELRGKGELTPMKSILWIPAAGIAALLMFTPKVFTQANPRPATSDSQETDAPVATTDTQDANINAYVELLRSNVKTKKVAILTELMQLNDDQSAKFWPIYREYDFELQKLNDQKLEGIKDYAKNYQNMTDEKANELALLALAMENKRNELKKTYYEKIRDQLGGIIAARFLQIENQMLMVVDLQIASSLPIVEN